jgi:hypothetical protein
VFSPFGLGVLDLAVGKYVYDQVVRTGELRVVEDFFYDLRDMDDRRTSLPTDSRGNLMPVISGPQEFNEAELYVTCGPSRAITLLEV